MFLTFSFSYKQKRRTKHMDLSDLYSKKTRLVKMLVFRSLCPKKEKSYYSVLVILAVVK